MGNQPILGVPGEFGAHGGLAEQRQDDAGIGDVDAAVAVDVGILVVLAARGAGVWRLEEQAQVGGVHIAVAVHVGRGEELGDVAVGVVFQPLGRLGPRAGDVDAPVLVEVVGLVRVRQPGVRVADLRR